MLSLVFLNPYVEPVSDIPKLLHKFLSRPLNWIRRSSDCSWAYQLNVQSHASKAQTLRMTDRAQAGKQQVHCHRISCTAVSPL